MQAGPWHKQRSMTRICFIGLWRLHVVTSRLLPCLVTFVPASGKTIEKHKGIPASQKYIMDRHIAIHKPSASLTYPVQGHTELSESHVVCQLTTANPRPCSRKTRVSLEQRNNGATSTVLAVPTTSQRPCSEDCSLKPARPQYLAP